MVSNPKAPDGGWGWVIVLCGFINHIFTVGLMMSLSVFYVSWLDQFGESKRDTSWIISIGVACLFGMCPLPAALADRWGFRVVAFVGALLTFSGLILSVFATSVTYLVVTIGLITGIGCSFCYIPGMATVAMYFDRRRALAMGLNTAGTGIGAFILAPLLNLLEEMYGWRGAILLLAAITLHMCVTGLLMRDLGPESENKMVEVALESDNENERKEGGEGLLEDSQNSALVATPTIKVVRDDENTNEDDVSLQLPKTQSASKRGDTFKGNGFGVHASHGDLRNNPLSLVKNNSHSSSFPSLDTRAFDRKCTHRSITKSIQNMDPALLASIPSLLNCKDRIGASEDSCVRIENTASVRRNPETSAHKWISVSRILSSKTIRTNLELFSNKAHVAYCVSHFITNLSYIAPVMFMVDRAIYEGISKSAGAFFVSANGIGNVVGRLTFGCMSDRCCVSHVCMYLTALIVCGVGTMLSDFCGNIFVLHVAYASFFGFLIGTYTVLSPLVCVDLSGVALFTPAYGQANFFMGFGGIFGPPIAGWLFDWTRSYTLSYLTIGFFLVLSGVMLLPLLCRKSKMPPALTYEE